MTEWRNNSTYNTCHQLILSTVIQIQFSHASSPLFYCRMAQFKNKAIEIPENELMAAKVMFCFSARAVTHGEFYLCKLARSTIRNYTSLMKKYIIHMQEVNIPMYPVSDQLWSEVMTYLPSQSRDMISRAKACWLLFCHINEQDFPSFVQGWFDGQRRINVPIKKPSKDPSKLINNRKFLQLVVLKSSPHCRFLAGLCSFVRFKP